jgi:hypothetical protein
MDGPFLSSSPAHLIHFRTTENGKCHGPAASHLTVYIEPQNSLCQRCDPRAVSTFRANSALTSTRLATPVSADAVVRTSNDAVFIEPSRSFYVAFRFRCFHNRPALRNSAALGSIAHHWHDP